MAKYYNADTLIEFIKQNIPHFDGETTMQCVERAILEAPTADVEEVKHGYWYDIDSDVGWELVGCSVCRKEYSLCEGEDKTDYCPYCGAKMDGGKAE